MKNSTSFNKTRIEKINDIIEQKSAMRIDGIMIDLFSASVYKNIYDTLSDKNKKTLEDLSLEKAIKICYKLLK